MREQLASTMRRVVLSEDRGNARRRALRAAQVVTLGLALAGTGCYGRVAPPGDNATAEDSGLQPAADGSPQRPDAGSQILDAGDAQDGALADAGLCVLGEGGVEQTEYVACCQAHEWSMRWGCMAWGPYVPPAEGDLPAPRASQFAEAA
jgi:hypothetical protein